MVGIVDQALEAGGSDSLEIASYHEALVDFIKKNRHTDDNRCSG